MSLSKFLIGGIVIAIAAAVAFPLIKVDFLSTAKSVDLNNPVGSYNNQIVKISDLNTQDRQSIFDAQTQLYNAYESILAQKYINSLIEQYAKDEKITDKNTAQQQYLQAKVHVTQNDIDTFIQNNINNPQLKGKTKQEQIALVQPYLMQRAISEFFHNLVEQARLDGKIKVSAIPLPQAPHIELNIGNAPSKGPQNAKVTIVEFADFQCPYCFAASATIKNILHKYQGKIRFVFKNYPLTQLHPQAVPAAIAAQCAQNQDKFWEMYDVLFDNHDKLTDALYPQLANKIGLNMSKFTTCLKDAKIKAEVLAAEEYGQSLGLRAAPAFYINGTLLMGAQPESEFSKIIDKLL